MSIFFTSDTHFGHANVIKYSSRPFSDVQNMNERMIENWYAVVQPNDTVYHLGDFAFLKLREIQLFRARLNGEIHLILGNHDKEISKNIRNLTGSTFASIQTYREVTVDEQKIILFHYGQRVWNKSHYGSIHLYGHSHGSLPPHGRSVDVGVDCKEITDEYRPIHLDEVLTYMKSREFEAVDHHQERERR